MTCITKEIKTASDNEKLACSIFLDFQKAFDTFNKKTITKFNHYGIRQIALDWFKLYLANTTQQSSTEVTISEETIISWSTTRLCPRACTNTIEPATTTTLKRQPPPHNNHFEVHPS